MILSTDTKRQKKFYTVNQTRLREVNNIQAVAPDIYNFEQSSKQDLPN